ncbi:MAG: molybdopterin-synthase adenylyltransferase MoeB [Thiotrichales bacterium]|nr:molybdopterin-synthase adenylyltransferase MoeB [Thiotrichales bacterium]
MNDDQFERYSRHMVLPQIGLNGQRSLLKSRVLLLGVGGLGSPIAMYLAASGVGTLVLADFDVVELSNLQRQIVHGTADIGRAKVDSGSDRIESLNPDVNVLPINEVLDADNSGLADEVARADVVIDATDNFETRFALNRLCVDNITPLVSGAALRMDAQVTVFDPRDDTSPCYRCLYSDEFAEGEACSDVGVFSPLLGIVGSIQAAEALKLIIGFGEPLVGTVLMIDAVDMSFRSLKLNKDPQCPVCGQ